MADVATAARGESGIAFLVAAGLTYEVVAACCSSPQTAEINAAARADTLMKWVHIGIVQAVIFVGIAAYVDKKHRTAIISGGVTAAALMYGQYWHAKNAGLKNPGPATESYGKGPGRPGAVRWGA